MNVLIYFFESCDGWMKISVLMQIYFPDSIFLASIRLVYLVISSLFLVLYLYVSTKLLFLEVLHLILMQT